MYQYHNSIPKADAIKVEISITRPDGKVVRMVCDAFDYVEFEKFMEPEYFSSEYFRHDYPRTIPQIARLALNIERPRHWMIYSPDIQPQPSIDDGNVVEEDGE